MEYENVNNPLMVEYYNYQKRIFIRSKTEIVKHIINEYGVAMLNDIDISASTISKIIDIILPKVLE